MQKSLFGFCGMCGGFLFICFLIFAFFLQQTTFFTSSINFRNSFPFDPFDSVQVQDEAQNKNIVSTKDNAQCISFMTSQPNWYALAYTNAANKGNQICDNLKCKVLNAIVTDGTSIGGGNMIGTLMGLAQYNFNPNSNFSPSTKICFQISYASPASSTNNDAEINLPYLCKFQVTTPNPGTWTGSGSFAQNQNQNQNINQQHIIKETWYILHQSTSRTNNYAPWMLVWVQNSNTNSNKHPKIWLFSTSTQLPPQSELIQIQQILKQVGYSNIIIPDNCNYQNWNLPMTATPTTTDSNLFNNNNVNYNVNYNPYANNNNYHNKETSVSIQSSTFTHLCNLIQDYLETWATLNPFYSATTATPTTTSSLNSYLYKENDNNLQNNINNPFFIF